MKMLRLLVSSALLAVCLSASIPNSELDHYWTVYKAQHGKAYAEDEEMYRRVLWEKNLQQIQQHNLEADLGLHSYRLALNQFADMTSQEFRESFLGLSVPANRTSKASHFLPLAHIELPEEVDWRKEGYVTDVKNQEKCGSCWAFAATGALEGQTFKKTKELVSLSEQNLIDCSSKYGNAGCQGGIAQYAFDYTTAKGIDTEESYPYEAKNARCRFKPEDVGARTTGYIDIPEGDEEALKQATATIGPIAIGVDVNSRSSFRFYHSGVYNEPRCSRSDLDHAMLIVGYGTYEGSKYWLVKNSWGTTWGLEGYVMMSRDKNNQCGIATLACYPLV